MAKSTVLQKAAAVAAGRAAPRFGSSSGKPEKRSGLKFPTPKRKRRAPYTNARARHNEAAQGFGAGAKPGATPAKQSLGKPAMNMQQAHARLAKRLQKA
jgi:hypothetical protein